VRRIISVLLGALSIASASGAFAADLPAKAPVYKTPVAAPYNWAGFYIGADVGGVWSKDPVRYTSVPGVLLNTAQVNASGVKGGLFAGYNWQLNSALVLGIEADIEATSLDHTTDIITTLTGVPVAGDQSTRDALPWEGSLRARLGYAAGNLLLYSTGGLAFAHINTKYANLTAPFAVDSYSHTETGWTAGGGLEYAFGGNLIARTEYRYAEFGAVKDTLVNTLAGIVGGPVAQHRVSENVVRFGFSYKLGN
jgi:outer membrane immunogenic protein